MADPEHFGPLGKRKNGRLGTLALDADHILSKDRDPAAGPIPGIPDLSQARHREPKVDRKLEQRYEELLAKAASAECPACLTREVLRRERDPVGVGQRYVARSYGADPNSPQAFGSAKLDFRIARNPEWMKSLGFEHRDEGIFVYPDAPGLNARLNKQSPSTDNGLRFVSDEGLGDTSAERATWNFNMHLADSKISIRSRGVEHFNSVEQVPAITLIPKRVVTAAVETAKVLNRLRDDFPELRPELYMPARNLRELIEARWPSAINDALTFRTAPLTSNLLNDNSLNSVGNQYTLSELERAFGGNTPRPQHDLEYVMPPQTLSPKGIAKWIRKKVARELSPERLTELDTFIASIGDVDLLPLSAADFAQITELNSNH